MIIFWSSPSSSGGSCDYPAESDVRDGVVYASGTMTGNFVTTITPETVADAVWNSLLTDHTTVGSYGVFVKKLLTVGKFLGLK